jgi:hypothetical protein
MRKKIKGRVYYTGTAQHLGTWYTQGIDWNDDYYCEERLFRTKSGAYFVHGSGGAATRYAQQKNGKWYPGEDITALTYNAAKQWARQKLSPDEYEQAFGLQGIDNQRVELKLTVSNVFKRKMDVLKQKTGKSISRLIEEKFKDLDV